MIKTPRPACNEPGKPRFRDRVGAALFAATRSRKYGQQMEAYRCPARHWHLRTVAKRRAHHLKGAKPA